MKSFIQTVDNLYTSSYPVPPRGHSPGVLQTTFRLHLLRCTFRQAG